jgi:hypothetical protein
MSRKRGFFAILLVVTILVALDRTSYYIAKRSLYRAYPGLAEAPIIGGGGLAVHPGTGPRVAWMFSYYQNLDLPSRGTLCETAQMWVSLTGQILETYPKGPGVAEWLRCVREDAS